MATWRWLALRQCLLVGLGWGGSTAYLPLPGAHRFSSERSMGARLHIVCVNNNRWTYSSLLIPSSTKSAYLPTEVDRTCLPDMVHHSSSYTPRRLSMRREMMGRQETIFGIVYSGKYRS